MVHKQYIIPITSNSTLDYGYDSYLVDASNGEFTMTLPTILADGMYYFLRRMDNSANTVTVNCSSEQLIYTNQPGQAVPSITLPISSDTVINSYNLAWYAIFTPGATGATGPIGTGTNSEFAISFSSSSSNGTYRAYIPYNSTTYGLIGNIYYSGSTYYGGNPTQFTIVLSPKTAGGTYNVRLWDFTNSQQIAILNITTSSVVKQAFTTTTFTNIPTDPALWEVQIRAGSSGNAGNIFNAYIRYT